MVEQWKRQTEELVASVLRIAVLKNSKNFQKSSAMEFYFSWSFLQLILHKWFLDGGGKMSNFLKSQPPDGESWTSESPWQKDIAGHITTSVALLECNLKTTIFGENYLANLMMSSITSFEKHYHQCKLQLHTISGIWKNWNHRFFLEEFWLVRMLWKSWDRFYFGACEGDRWQNCSLSKFIHLVLPFYYTTKIIK